jgi:heptosyltransferase-2
MRIAIFLPNWIGDVVMATPTLRAVRRRFPAATLIGVMRPYVGDVLAGTSWLDEILHYDPRSRSAHLRVRSLISRLRRHDPGVALLLTNSLRTGVLGWLSGAKRRVGYARYGRGPLLTDKRTYPKARGRFVPFPAVDAYLELAYMLGCPPEPPRTELETLPQDEAAADRLWASLSLPPGQRVIVLNSGGAYGSAKSWPSEYFGELARRIADEQGYGVLVLCGPSERAVAAEIAAAAQHPSVKSLAEQELSIGLSKACVRRSRLMVSTDSGPRHFAAAFDVPVVTLYGPTHVTWGDTHFPRAVHLQEDLPCGPCMKRSCPLGHHRCMRELPVQRVYGAVCRLLAATEITHAA